MCYSVMVEADLRKLQHDFQAEVDVEGFLQLLAKRKAGAKNLRSLPGVSALGCARGLACARGKGRRRDAAPTREVKGSPLRI